MRLGGWAGQVLEEELFSLLIDIYRSPKIIRILSDHDPQYATWTD